MAVTSIRQRALRLEAWTIGWNALEGVVALAAGTIASSTALVGFGLDSVVEVGAASVVVWELLGASTANERRVLRLIAISFFAMAAYVAFSSIRDLVVHAEPDTAPVGIALCAASMMLMPLLSRAKHRAAHDMNSKALLADSNQTKLCAYLSASTLAGLVANAALGWWWADPTAALFIAFVAVTEGRNAWSGKDDCH